MPACSLPLIITASKAHHHPQTALAAPRRRRETLTRPADRRNLGRLPRCTCPAAAPGRDGQALNPARAWPSPAAGALTWAALRKSWPANEKQQQKAEEETETEMEMEEGGSAERGASSSQPPALGPAPARAPRDRRPSVRPQRAAPQLLTSSAAAAAAAAQQPSALLSRSLPARLPTPDGSPSRPLTRAQSSRSRAS